MRNNKVKYSYIITLLNEGIRENYKERTINLLYIWPMRLPDVQKPCVTSLYSDEGAARV